MKKTIILAISLTCSFSFAQLNDISMSPSATTVALTLSSLCAAGQCSQKVMDAKEDAAIFVASEGAFRSPQLMTAFEYLRNSAALAAASEQDLAEAIIAY